MSEVWRETREDKLEVRWKFVAFGMRNFRMIHHRTKFPRPEEEFGRMSDFSHPDKSFQLKLRLKLSTKARECFKIQENLTKPEIEKLLSVDSSFSRRSKFPRSKKLKFHKLTSSLQHKLCFMASSSIEPLSRLSIPNSYELSSARTIKLIL